MDGHNIHALMMLTISEISYVQKIGRIGQHILNFPMIDLRLLSLDM